MAHAARLNLRMQKELKLLLTDPPPGASFPTLSGDSSASSLTSIYALLRGPEGTVYANGVFKIKIQIPERYPFQPPIVTFATPVYHPNIDSGGRICLDILNLPPKGMWQPSLNISTVITSIGLLLSEPNPDDGLMHESSRDYKYNRQAFDQNARSMTEKYAKAGESESARGSHQTQTHTGASMSTTEYSKLSLEFIGSSSNEGPSGKEMYKVSTHDYSRKNIEFGPPLKEANNDLSKCTGKLLPTRNKLSLNVSVASHNRSVESEDTISLPNCCSSLLETLTTSTDSPESMLSMQVGNISNRDGDHIERSHNTSVSWEQQSLQCVRMGQSRSSDEKLQGLDTTKSQQGFASSSRNKTNARAGAAIARKGNYSNSTRIKKIGLAVQNHLVDEKENLDPVQCLAPQPTNQSSASTIIISVLSENGLYSNESRKQIKNDVLSDKKQEQINRVCVRDSSADSKSRQVVGGVVEGSQVADAVIVLDSEESEDELAPMRSKLSLAKRCCLPRKRKSAH